MLYAFLRNINETAPRFLLQAFPVGLRASSLTLVDVYKLSAPPYPHNRSRSKQLPGIHFARLAGDS